MNKITTILFCAEKGLLEQQAKLLVESLVHFGGSSHLQLIAFSPRSGFYPSLEACDFFTNNNVIHIKENLNTDYLDYPIANKVLACDYVESNYPEYDSIMFVDTDTVFLNPIDTKLLQSKNKLYVRPVDNKGPGSQGLDDENDAFWQEVYTLFDLETPKAQVTTTVRPHLIRPYYNAGFIWANGLSGFFAQWKKDFVKLVDSGLRPFGYQSRDNTDFRCLDQVALAVTSQRFADSVEVLSQTYNYPIPFRPILKLRDNHPRFDELVHVHYHKWFQHPGFLDYVTDDEEKKTSQYLWLKEHLPLLPVIDGGFKC
jgi:lipopolysaccharide biosynthesis glycosyltransferase